jgi:pSer/pThr/pTyr-binding forkhead associated (FHA) protein
MSQPEPQATDQPTAHLQVQIGPNPNQIFDLFQEQHTIGRSPANDITIADPEISRKHARLIQQGTDYAIEDLGSTNGTFVNNRRVAGLTPLHDGDIIEFGEAIRLLYEAESTLPVELPTVPDLIFPDPSPPKPESPIPAAAPIDPPPFIPQPTTTEAATETSASWRKNIFVGCGLLLLLLFCCTSTLFFLDAYEQGRLLYCGPLQPFWELVLGPFGFAPLCT